MCVLMTDSVVITLAMSLLNHSPYACCMMNHQKPDHWGFRIVHVVRTGPESGLWYLFMLKNTVQSFCFLGFVLYMRDTGKVCEFDC